MILIHSIVAAIATMSFAILFHAPKKELPFCGFAGGVAWLVYESFVMADAGKTVASFIATFILMFFARSLAVARRMPITVYLLTGIFPLVPGAGIYYTAYYMFLRKSSLFSAKGIETFEIACAIVLGIVLGFAVPQTIFTRLFRRHLSS